MAVPNDLTREQRDAFLQALADNAAKQSARGDDRPDTRTRRLLMEEMFNLLAAYGDALPRLPMSVCPLCETVLERSIDPFGFEGVWWETDPRCPLDEPKACEHFRVLLGAVDLHGRVPEEARRTVLPGPDVPFVVPDLLSHPGMIAVVAALPLARGDTGYPIAYFSPEPVAPVALHQPWGREYFYFENEEGDEGWSIANSVFDFELAPYLESGQLRWARLDSESPRVVTQGGDEAYPFAALEGDQRPQALAGGERNLLEPPDGELVNPYDQ